MSDKDKFSYTPGGGAPLSSIATVFRQAELERRAVRQAQLLNEAKLADEVLTPEDQTIHDEAIRKVEEQRAAYAHQAEMQQGYWRRLWNALLSK